MLCLLAGFALFGAPALLAQAPHPLDAAAGKALFERQWVAAPASTAASDGLGPLYNARACAACHPRGGSSAAVQHRVLRIDDPVYGRQLQTRALSGLQPEARIILQEGASATTAPADKLGTVSVAVDQLAHGPLLQAWSLRAPPALYAVAAIDAVSSESLHELADPTDRDGDGISGRVAALSAAGRAQVGRFGWKAESPSLAHQVALAFSLDLGLGSAWFPAPHGDCTPVQDRCRRGVDGSVTGAGDFELDTRVIELILTWLRTLDGAALPADEAGLSVFYSAGCAACHRPQLDGHVLFSDLLLHDMGPGLADSLPLAHAEAGEWRTAPLVGLGRKQRYLHDGRALSIREAILWHAGEANTAREAWLALPAALQERLDGFLRQL